MAEAVERNQKTHSLSALIKMVQYIEEELLDISHEGKLLAKILSLVLTIELAALPSE